MADGAQIVALQSENTTERSYPKMMRTVLHYRRQAQVRQAFLRFVDGPAGASMKLEQARSVGGRPEEASGIVEK